MSMIGRLRKHTRAARQEKFQHFLKGIGDSGDRPRKIVDLGGTVAFWENWWSISEKDRLHITLVNHYAVDPTGRGQVSKHTFIESRIQDATTLAQDDLCRYDMIFSNSFFEHLKSWREQQELAARITSSGVPYFMQIPNKHSPVDPHCPYVPYWALYPKRLRVRLVMFSSFGNPGGSKALSLEAARRWQGAYTPLGLRDVKRLFPDASLEVERPFGVPMSILALRGYSDVGTVQGDAAGRRTVSGV